MSDKYIALNSNGIQAEVASTVVSTGVTEAGKIVGLDSNGRLDVSVMPVGIGADTNVIVASEALAAGDFVNVYDATGTPKVRKADATTAGKYANGFVLASVAQDGNATVYAEGTNNQVTGATAGRVFLSTTAGGFTSTPPSASGNVTQSIGYAVSATAINFQAGEPVIRA